MKTACFKMAILPLLAGAMLVMAPPVDAKSPASAIAGKIVEKAAAKATARTVTKGAQKRATAKAIKPHIVKKLPAKIASTFAGGRYNQRRLKTPMIVYRYHGDYNERPRRFAYLTTERYANELAARHSLAIPAIPAGGRGGYRHIRWISRYELPKGTLISEGRAAPHRQFKGGGVQIVVENLPGQWRRGTLSFRDFRASATAEAR